MKTKTFEIRDRATCISAVAIYYDHREAEAECRAHPGADGEGIKRDTYLFHRAGFGPGSSGAYVLLTNLHTMATNYDVHNWRDRTMSVAHRHIAERWDELETGCVIDVEYILGETETPKRSSR